MDKKEMTNVMRLMTETAKKMRKHNIPLIMVVGDRERSKTGVLMDDRQETRDMNISILLDAMVNTYPALLNVIMGAATIMMADVPGIENQVMENLVKMKATQKEAKVINNKAEA